MQDRFAFTAKYWGRGAVVCRAGEHRAGPVVAQEFGHFDTWTQANAFARQLNEGLEIDPAETHQVVAGSMLQADEVMAAAHDAKCSIEALGCVAAASSIRVQYALAELDLALTFCRIIQSNPGQRTARLLRNARNALFNAMHYIVRDELTESDLLEITERIQELQVALQTAAPDLAEVLFAADLSAATSSVDSSDPASS